MPLQNMPAGEHLISLFAVIVFKINKVELCHLVSKIS